MNSSDIIARRKAMVVYTDLLEKLKAANPSGDCQNLCNCTSVNCNKKQFSSYELKMLFESATKNNVACPCAPSS